MMNKLYLVKKTHTLLPLPSVENICFKKNKTYYYETYINAYKTVGL